MQEKISLTWWVYVHVGVREIHLFPIDASAFENDMARQKSSVDDIRCQKYRYETPKGGSSKYI